MDAVSTEKPMALPRELGVFIKLQAGMAVFCAIMIAINVFIKHHHYPYNTPFLRFSHFVDFYTFQYRFAHFHHPDFFSTLPDRGVPFSYPPPGALPYELFYLLPKHQHLVFVIATTVPVILMAVMLGRAMVRNGVRTRVAAGFLGASTLLAFPFWFEFMLGNTEICIFLMVAAGLIAWLRLRPLTAAILFGLAGSMKVFPLIFLGLLLARKQYRQFAAGLLTALVMYPLAAWLECGSLSEARRGTAAGAAVLNTLLVLRWNPYETSFDHSIFGIFKQLKHMLGFANQNDPRYLTIYVVSAAIGGLAAYFLVIRKLPMVNQVLCLTIASVLLPPMSHDYTLMHMYLPWGLMIILTVKAWRQGHQLRGMYAAFACFGFLLSFDSMIIVKGAAFAGQLKALTLMALFYIGATNPWQIQQPTDAFSNTVREFIRQNESAVS